ncbi:Ribosomal protein S5 domain 2-type fold subgroup [Penicillium macrosclerotiorum]|uniref:Ribosomal protein S5 domain 2-type fold subgroup n=1 Tax=Penicillium macrosclerotiorum TaxID=303699 RepID=UPI0025497384|nr:Ribosomal protein S5 domain 2-type fold subgroup [Penicillium macrosclerotiorum]KAJ5698376.1 Ribosomal protein S5 domain 2-type fold subgroup [Penicillium macrosclerotiorum]
MPPSQLSLRVPAKINPQLRVGPLRPDGYHDITLVYQAISLYDTLTISHDPQGPTIEVTGIDRDRIPADARNLVIKAAHMLAGRAEIAPRLHFQLAKSIPTEAGLGGGSADAAAALVGCNILWGLCLSAEELMAMGAQLGEDVPFFVQGMMALGLGHKQPLRTLEPSQHTWHWVLGVPFRGLSTKAVFEKYDEILARFSNNEEAYSLRRQKCIETAWTFPPEQSVTDLANDLELPSKELLPDIATALEAGRSAGALGSIMSGSGSTCAFLARDESHAKELMAGLQKEKVFREVIAVSGPVAGVTVASK